MKISVIVPVYKAEQYLEKCLESLVMQTLDDIEIIVVNDGSPDNSQSIIDSFQKRYPDKIKSIVQENGGQAAARNTGLGHASGDYISFVDSDDYLEFDAYKCAYLYAEENQLDIVCFGFYEVKADDKYPVDYTVIFDDDCRVRYILNETSPWNKLIKRDLIEKNGIRFTENRIYEDLELIPQLALFTDKIGFMEDRLYNYVIHQGSTMRLKTYSEKLANIYLVADTLKKKFEATEYRDELEYLFIEHLLHGAVLRYLGYEEGKKDIVKIADIVKSEFPKWRSNKYYKMRHWKYKVMCNLAYLKMIPFLKLIFGEK